MSTSRWVTFACGIGLIAGGIGVSIFSYPQFAVLAIPGVALLFLGAMIMNNND